jgi:uncharacterized membrane protein YebE (DUF533 family)
MADDDIQVTTPLGQTFIIPRGRRTVRPVDAVRGKGLAAHLVRGVGRVDETETAPVRAPQPAPAAPLAESHERLTPATAATLSQMHAVEAEVMVRAMIEAAKSDGEIDAEERRRILTCLKDSGALAPDRQALLASMDAPPDMDGLVQRVTNPELAVEVYAASLLAIQDDTPVEQRYLATLAERLKLPADTVRDVHARYEAPPPLEPKT